jgi:hypothetical protein
LLTTEDVTGEEIDVASYYIRLISDIGSSRETSLMISLTSIVVLWALMSVGALACGDEDDDCTSEAVDPRQLDKCENEDFDWETFCRNVKSTEGENGSCSLDIEDNCLPIPSHDETYSDKIKPKHERSLQQIKTVCNFRYFFQFADHFLGFRTEPSGYNDRSYSWRVCRRGL